MDGVALRTMPSRSSNVAACLALFTYLRRSCLSSMQIPTNGTIHVFDASNGRRPTQVTATDADADIFGRYRTIVYLRMQDPQTDANM